MLSSNSDGKGSVGYSFFKLKCWNVDENDICIRRPTWKLSRVRFGHDASFFFITIKVYHCFNYGKWFITREKENTFFSHDHFLHQKNMINIILRSLYWTKKFLFDQRHIPDFDERVIRLMIYDPPEAETNRKMSIRIRSDSIHSIFDSIRSDLLLKF
jgi:hypothetical protein